jgi:squalene-associated FAD-dependent desaturase
MARLARVPLMDSRPRIAVLGAGWAGLAAAVHLARSGCRVVVLEKRAVPGGRAYSYTDPATGDVLDNGPHIFLGCYSGTLRFLEAVDPQTRIRFSRDLRIAFADRERGPFQFRCPPLPAPLHLLFGLLGLGGLDRRDRWRALRVGMELRRRRGSDFHELEEITLLDWLEGLGQNAAIRRAIWNPIAIAALNEVPQLSSAAVFARVLDQAFLSGQPSTIGLGAFGLTDILGGPAVDYLARQDCEVRLRTGVARIEIGRGGVEGLVLGDGARLTADAYLSTLPPFEFLAALPETVRGSDPYFGRIAGLGTSPILSVHLWYDRPFLDERWVGLLGTSTQWLFDRWAIFGPKGKGTEPVARSAGAGYSAVISAGRDYIDWPASDIIAMAEEDIAACIGAATGARLLRARVVKERHATISPRVGSSRLRPAAQSPVPNLILGGDWTDTGLPGCIEGAVRSGERAAAETVHFLQRTSGFAPAGVARGGSPARAGASYRDRLPTEGHTA